MKTAQKLKVGQHEYRVEYIHSIQEINDEKFIVATSIASAIEQAETRLPPAAKIKSVTLIEPDEKAVEPPIPQIPTEMISVWSRVLTKCADLLNLVVESNNGQIGIPEFTSGSSAGRLMYDTATSIMERGDIHRAKQLMATFLYENRRGIPFYRFDMARELFKTAESREREITEAATLPKIRKYTVSIGHDIIGRYASQSITIQASSAEEAGRLAAEQNAGWFVTAVFMDE